MSQFVSMLPWAFYCYFQGFVIGSHVQDPFISLWYFRLNLSPFQIKATQILNGIALNVQVIFDRNKILAFLSLLIHKKVLYLFRLTLIFLTWFCGFHCLDLLFNSFIIYIFYAILSETDFGFGFHFFHWYCMDIQLNFSYWCVSLEFVELLIASKLYRFFTQMMISSENTVLFLANMDICYFFFMTNWFLTVMIF